LGKTKLLGFLLTFIFLGLVLWRTNLSELGGALSSANYLYVIPAAFCTLISYILRTIRWRRILLPTRSIPARRLFPVLMIGFMANNVLPARLGEFVRAYSLGQKESISKSLSFATIMLERLLDGVTLVVILALISLSVPLQDWGAEIAYIACAVFLAAAIGVVALLVREDLARRLIFLVLRPWPRATAERFASRADSFVLGLHALRGGRAVVVLLLYSAAIWTVETTMYFLVLRGFNVQLDVQTTVLAAALLLVVVNLGIMLPSAPGYIGTFQFFGVLALSTFAIQRELALSITIVAHSIQYVLVTGLGLIFFSQASMSFKTPFAKLSLESARPEDVPGTGELADQPDLGSGGRQAAPDGKLTPVGSADTQGGDLGR